MRRRIHRLQTGDQHLNPLAPGEIGEPLQQLLLGACSSYRSLQQDPWQPIETPSTGTPCFVPSSVTCISFGQRQPHRGSVNPFQKNGRRLHDARLSPEGGDQVDLVRCFLDRRSDMTDKISGGWIRWTLLSPKSDTMCDSNLRQCQRPIMLFVLHRQIVIRTSNKLSNREL